MKTLARFALRLITFVYNLIFRRNILSSRVSICLKIDKTNKVSFNVSIDKNCKLGCNNFIAEGTLITKTEIGSYCSFAPYTKIGLGEHNYRNISTSGKISLEGYENLTKEKCIIGSDVWIGTNAVILRGVVIGDGAVIGANAVVTKDVPAFAIVAGVPAKVLKYRFSANKIEKIQKSQWWNYNLIKARLIVKKLENEK